MAPFRILLIDAAEGWLTQRKDLRDLEQVVLPHALMLLSAIVKQRFGDSIEIRVRHTLVDLPDEGDLERELRDLAPDLVGIRGLHVYRKRFHEVAAAARRVRPGATVLGGGAYCTAAPAEALADENIDAVVVGEGDQTLPEVVERLLAGERFDDVPGVAVRGEDDTKAHVLRHPRAFVDDLDTLPFPDYDVVDLERYERYVTYGYNRRRQGVVMSSRGCPYRCAYCHNMFGRKFRARSADNVVSEIRALHDERNVRDIYFIDDNFNMDRERVERFCDLMADGPKVNLYFANGLRADLLDPPLIDRLIEAGMIWVTYALETATPRLQKLIRKNIKLDRLREVIAHTCARDVMVNVCFMVGFPTETEDEARATLDFVHQFDRLVVPMFFSVKYYPNTDMFKIGLEHGLDLERSDAAYDEPYHDVSHGGTPTLPPVKLKELYYRFLRETFMSRTRLENALRIQRQYMDEQELLDAYSLFFRRRIRDIEKDVLRFAR